MYYDRTCLNVKKKRKSNLRDKRCKFWREIFGSEKMKNKHRRSTRYKEIFHPCHKRTHIGNYVAPEKKYCTIKKIRQRRIDCLFRKVRRVSLNLTRFYDLIMLRVTLRSLLLPRIHVTSSRAYARRKRKWTVYLVNLSCIPIVYTSEIFAGSHIAVDTID